MPPIQTHNAAAANTTTHTRATYAAYAIPANMTVSSANSAPSAGLLAFERLFPFALVCAVALSFLLVLERAALGGLIGGRA